jgi:hypothetical protein
MRQRPAETKEMHDMFSNTEALNANLIAHRRAYVEIISKHLLCVARETGKSENYENYKKFALTKFTPLLGIVTASHEDSTSHDTDDGEVGADFTTSSQQKEDKDEPVWNTRPLHTRRAHPKNRSRESKDSSLLKRTQDEDVQEQTLYEQAAAILGIPIVLVIFLTMFMPYIQSKYLCSLCSVNSTTPHKPEPVETPNENEKTLIAKFEEKARDMFPGQHFDANNI